MLKEVFMSTYIPDRWVMLKLKNDKEEVYKVFAGWAGSYLGGQSWKLNSGVTKVEEEGEYYLFHGYSGSVYKCHKNGYGMTSYMGAVFDNFSPYATLMDNMDFTTLLK
jgi:hypothetical protein